MNKPLVSIVIAAYNAEQYLPRCLDSMIAQTYKNIEIIVVDDASTDGTMTILKDYASKDERIRVLCMEKNSGAPAARNKGMKATKGEFMTTVDADDTLAADAIELSVNMMIADPELDFVLYNLMLVESTPSDSPRITPFPINPKVKKTIMTGEEACYWSMQWDIPGLGMTRSPLEQDMPEEAKFGQYGDETTTHLIFLKSRKVALGEGKYFYYQNPASYTKKISTKRFEILECRLSLRQHLLKLGVDDRMIKRLDVRRWRELIGACYLYWKHSKTFSEEEREDIWERLNYTYSTLHFNELPLTEILKPRFTMMPTFGLFYWQLSIVFRLGLIHTE
jgi:glycosyltransferase involved in cell wall biosynthesis